MSLEHQRLRSLIEFAQQSAKLRTKTVSTVSQHGNFALYEGEINGLPGIRLNVEETDHEQNAWLEVERFSETPPPETSDKLLSAWIDIPRNPDVEPRLKNSIHLATLASAAYGNSLERGDGKSPPDRAKLQQEVLFAEYEQRTLVEGAFANYVELRWRPWSATERPRRKTIEIYKKLFTLRQFLTSGLFESQLEVVWGVGVARWRNEETKFEYPLLTQLVDLSIEPKTAAISVKSRATRPMLEVDWYAATDNTGVEKLETFCKKFFSNEEIVFSPFEKLTFNPVLKAGATHLDPGGVFWPDRTHLNDRDLPPWDNHLRVSDTWVIFARQRTNNVFIEDLERFKEAIVDPALVLPGAVAAVVTDPLANNPIVDLPEFRGVSGSASGSAANPVGLAPLDLYFPKPFNDEQVRIIQQLEVSDGVAVQGPPGTGKTHTIANIIAHYLATGRRVLVTSLKEPALTEVREKLPQDIKPLAVPLLTTEQEGMSMFRFAIEKIAAEVQILDRRATTREIEQLAEDIDSLHGQLSQIDHQLADWARSNLEPIIIDEEKIRVEAAAREVMLHLNGFQIIPDLLNIGPEFASQFSDSDIRRLREARTLLGKDLEYLAQPMPHAAEFPSLEILLKAHRDLSEYTRLTRRIEENEIAALAGWSDQTFTVINATLVNIARIREIDGQLGEAQAAWSQDIGRKFEAAEDGDLVATLEIVGRELEECADKRRRFLVRPISISDGVENDQEVVEAVRNLAEGKSAFGLMGLFGRSEAKQQLEAVLIGGDAPLKEDDWKYVLEFIDLQKDLRGLVFRWNAIAAELKLPVFVECQPIQAMQAAQIYSTVKKLKERTSLERTIDEGARSLLPRWPDWKLRYKSDPMMPLEMTLRQHLTRQQLATAWGVKETCERILQGRSGSVISTIRRFLADILGSPEVSDADLQLRWSALMEELVRINDLRPQLRVVVEVTAKIEDSGAPLYARSLRNIVVNSIDALLPNNWRECWRLRRLANHLEGLDAHDELKKLWMQRKLCEINLARAYQDVVVKRTWLKLAENASPAVRSSLQAYLNAVKNLGKGTGKSASRYREDARKAAAASNVAIPCWIMPHHRISETLPAQYGAFDLVVIDEASQSDMAALPALLRAKKILVVGDDKQVSPDGVGLDGTKVVTLMNRFLADQVPIFRAQMSPDRSMYDLFKVVFAHSSVMLKEHFRCVAPIIEYSKREFYNHELHPLRTPRSSERLDPPLIDILVEDGYRNGDINLPEVRFIVQEIKRIASDPLMHSRTIGVVSLLGSKQAYEIWQRLVDDLGPDIVERHQLECGDARTFQGKERHIMFLSMVAAPNDVGMAQERIFAQRFNVAASRAQDRTYLVRSLEIEDLKSGDTLRRNLIAHFSSPFFQDEARVENLRDLCESEFETELYDDLSGRGYWVTPQVKVGRYRIDLVVEGSNDCRLAVECDGDKHHGPDKWIEDTDRQRVLERAGWTFWRCFASNFVRHREMVMKDLVETLSRLGVSPVGSDRAPRSVYTEFRRFSSSSTVGVEIEGAVGA
jgi:very-short-patch-repair endonuclease